MGFIISLGEAHPDKDKKCAGCPIQRSPDRFVVSYCSLKADANLATIMHHTGTGGDKCESKYQRRRGTFAFDAGSINCGRNAREKSATLGLSTFVRMPCQKPRFGATPKIRRVTQLAASLQMDLS